METPKKEAPKIDVIASCKETCKKGLWDSNNKMDEDVFEAIRTLVIF